jgi:hypothetical protein
VIFWDRMFAASGIARYRGEFVPVRGGRHHRSKRTSGAAAGGRQLAGPVVGSRSQAAPDVMEEDE